MDKWDFSVEIRAYLDKERKVEAEVAPYKRGVADLCRILSGQIEYSFLQGELPALETKMAEMGEGAAITGAHVKQWGEGFVVLLGYSALEGGDLHRSEALMGRWSCEAYLNRVFKKEFERIEKERGYKVLFGDEVLLMCIDLCKDGQEGAGSNTPSGSSRGS